MLLGLYRAILRLCPAEIRDEYAAEMEAAFLQSLEIERARRGGQLADFRERGDRRDT